MKDLKIKKGDRYYPNTPAIYGTYVSRGTEYSFNGKIFYEPSCWGINCGRVSELNVTNKKTDKIVFMYDRGLIRGTEKQIESGMIHDLVEFLEVYAVEAWEAMFVR